MPVLHVLRAGRPRTSREEADLYFIKIRGLTLEFQGETRKGFSLMLDECNTFSKNSHENKALSSFRK